MVDWYAISIMAVIVLCFVTVYGIEVFYFPELNQQPPSQYQINYTCTNQTVIIREQCEPVKQVVCRETVPEWEAILKEFAWTHEYIPNRYVCTDFARDSAQILKDAGYMARRVRGHCEGMGNINHAWVEVRLWYEPQTGEMIPMGECYENR